MCARRTFREAHLEGAPEAEQAAAREAALQGNCSQISTCIEHDMSIPSKEVLLQDTCTWIEVQAQAAIVVLDDYKASAQIHKAANRHETCARRESENHTWRGSKR
jgi:hypothetical protein